MPRTFLYCCPRTSQNVQGTVDHDPRADGTKQCEAVECAARRGFHFVNVEMLKLLADEIEH